MQSTLSIDVGGRQVKAVIDGPAFISSDGDTAVITIGGRKLRVEKERLVLDNKEQAKLPAGAKKVEVEYVAGKLTAMADGAPLEIGGQAR